MASGSIPEDLILLYTRRSIVYKFRFTHGCSALGVILKYLGII